jgi:alkylhydroperoxidase family enzyme
MAPLQPLPPEDWPNGLEQIRRRLGKPLNVHNVMANHAGLMQAWMPFRDHIVANSSLPPRQRELVILRTALNCKSDYEWQHHVVRGRAAGLTDEEMARVRRGGGDGGWSAADALLLRAADDGFADNCISDDVLKGMSGHFDHEQVLDVIATVGMYITLAMIIRTFHVPMEAD